MNNQLIPVFSGELSGETIQLVDARLLHTFLESSQHFSDWIKSRIADYGFVNDQDFLVSEFYDTKSGRGGNRKSIIDYHLSIAMAKELGMIERSGKGQQIRRYFLAMEKQAKAASDQNALRVSHMQRELLKSSPRLRDVLRLTRAGFSIPDIARFTLWGKTTVTKEQKRLRECGFVLRIASVNQWLEG